MTHSSPHALLAHSFDGPIGLLLELIERNKVEITTVSLERLTAEYLERVSSMNQIDPGQLAEFVQLGSRLAYIKSLALLPGPDQAAEELGALESELAEYRRYRHAAELLSERLREVRTYGKGSRHLHASTQPAVIGLEALTTAFEAALKRAKPLPQATILRRHLDIHAVIGGLRQRLTKGGLGLQSLIDDCRDRLEVVVTFLAVLELLKDGTISATQADTFGDIQLEQIGATS